MKLFQIFFKREPTPTPIELLAEYESKIAYNQSVIENATASCQLLTNVVSKGSWVAGDLNKFISQINDYNTSIDKAKSDLKYYEILRNALKKELGNQES